jgi:hypothetical protein
LRELIWLSAGRREHDWNIASSVMALLAELHRDRKKRGRPFKPAEFNPLAGKTSKPIPTTVMQLGSLLGITPQRRDGDGVAG